MIVAISGATASGKTSLAHSMAARAGGLVASFGDYVRALTMKQGRSMDRPTLQAVGQAAVEAGAGAFLADFLQWTGWRGDGLLVIDGLRHTTVRDALRAHAANAGIEVRFVHLEAETGARVRRLQARGDDLTSIMEQDAHSSERDVRTRLRDEADLRVHRHGDVVATSAFVEVALGL